MQRIAGPANASASHAVVESHKTTQGGRGYQPMLALWAEADLIVADQFRDGNVPAHQEPLTCCQLAFAALRPSPRATSAVTAVGNLLDCSDQRQQEPGGGIGFAISARMSPELRRAATLVKWTTFAADGTMRQWAELVYPSKKTEHKDRAALRRPAAAQGAGRVVRRATESGDHLPCAPRLLQWHREKAGTIEHAHDELKNGFGRAHAESTVRGQRGVAEAGGDELQHRQRDQGAVLESERTTARFKKYR